MITISKDLYEQFKEDIDNKYVDIKIDNVSFDKVKLSKVFKISDNDKLKNYAKVNDIYELAYLDEINAEQKIKKLDIEKFSTHLVYPVLDNDRVNSVKLINKFTNLRELKMINQFGFSKLDVSNLNELVDLQLVGNRDLKTVVGIDEGSNITNFTCVDCGNVTLDQFGAFIDNKLYSPANKGENELGELKLDVQMFPQFLTLFENNLLDKNFANASMDKIKWCEQISATHKVIEYKYAEMEHMHKKAQKIADDCMGGTRLQTIYNTLDWFRKNCKYDQLAIDDVPYTDADGEFRLGKSSRHHKIINENMGAIFLKGKEYGVNGIKNVLLLHQGVCEGFAETFNYICGLNGIKAEHISVKPKSQKELTFGDYVPTHGISSVEIGGVKYYCDPTFEISGYKRTKKEEFGDGLMGEAELTTNYYVFGDENKFRLINNDTLLLLHEKLKNTTTTNSATKTNKSETTKPNNTEKQM